MTVLDHITRNGATLQIQREGKSYRLIYLDRRGRIHTQTFTSYTRAHQTYLQQKNTL